MARLAGPKRARGRAEAGRPGLVVFSPLPPMPTGIGDYTYELLPALAEHYDCTVVAEDGSGRLRVPCGVRLTTLRAYTQAAGAYDDAVHLYMVGNNPDHVYLLPTLARRPGVVVLHDPNLHHLLDCATASLGDAEGYGAALQAEYGEPGRILGEQWALHALRDPQMEYDMPMLRHLLGPARHVLVHSRTAAHRALAQAPDTPVTIAPHQYAPPAVRVQRAVLRDRLGIGAEEIVFLSLGFVSHIKRVDTALRALARVAGRLPPFRYVIAGTLQPDELDVGRLARQLGLEGQVITTGFVAEADFFGMIDMADIVINLRHPVGGETSGTLIRALGSGACVVVVDEGPFAELPDGVAIKLPWGPGFEAELADTLLRLAITPAARAQIGARAAAVIARRHHPQATVTAYRAAIDAAAGAPDRPWRCDTAWGFAAPQHRIGRSAPLWAVLGAVPHAAGVGRMLALGTPADLASLRGLGHDVDEAEATWQPEAAARRGRDLVFLRLRAGDALLQQAGLLASLNRLLRFGGVLVLCVGGVEARRHALAARSSGARVLRAAGFEVDAAGAAFPPGLEEPAHDEAPAEDGIVWRAIKVSEFIMGRASAA